MSEEIEAFDSFEKNVRNLPSVARIKQVGGEEQREPGQTNEATTDYNVHLFESAKEKINEERQEGVKGDPESNLLNDIRRRIAFEFEGTTGDYRPDEGILEVSYTHSRS